ncbi:MAG: helix-turn-helix transcriptional regulator [Ruminococcaceae bacterium]|nr:helix-turn-helix transcriptional regulator [Oscillospiraceae bacterium]
MSIDIFSLLYNFLRVMHMNRSIGDKIRILREEANLNQTQLGKELNITQRKLSYIECNKYEPSVEDIRAICNYFKISADYLLDIKKGYGYPNR